MPFKAGENWNGNASGRPKGAVNRRTQEILDLIKERGDVDPLVVLSEIASTSPNPEHRITASTNLAPYLHSKRGTIPAPRFVADPFEVPTFQTIDQAEDYLAEIPQRVGRGELDFQSGIDFSNMIRNWIEAKLAHTNTDLKVAAQGALGDATIRIEGGMPALPGTSIIMDDTAVGSSVPAINGHQGPSIEHQPSEVQAVIPPHGSVEPPKDDSSQGPSDGPE